MRPTKAAIFAAAVAVTASGVFTGVASAEPDPAPGPAPTPLPGPPPAAAPGPPPPGVPGPPPPAVPATAMDHDGTFVVGTDIEPGTYASAGPVEDGACYWKRMADLHGGDIIDNAFSKQPQTVLIDATDKAFKTSGCQPWQKTDAAAAPAPATGAIPALIAKAKLRAWLNTINNNARQFDGSQVPLP